MNYRHAFHAGNFADIHKHALLLSVLDNLLSISSPLVVIDTHAGAGLYDLREEAARRTGEAEFGARELMRPGEAPPSLEQLRAAVARCNPDPGPPRFYPGSPLLISRRISPMDRYLGCELRADDHDALARTLEDEAVRNGPRLEARRADGYDAAAAAVRAVPGRTLLLIDPPYERGDDAERLSRLLASCVHGGFPTPALVWAPIKDLETHDALLRRLESLSYDTGWTAEARLRPLTDPTRLNGSALIGLGVDPPTDTLAVSRWAASRAGGAGAEGRLTALYG